MRTIYKERKKRGCRYCADVIDPSHPKCPHAECPYHELDDIESFAAETLPGGKFAVSSFFSDEVLNDDFCR